MAGFADNEVIEQSSVPFGHLLKTPDSRLIPDKHLQTILFASEVRLVLFCCTNGQRLLTEWTREFAHGFSFNVRKLHSHLGYRQSLPVVIPKELSCLFINPTVNPFFEFPCSGDSSDSDFCVDG